MCSCSLGHAASGGMAEACAPDASIRVQWLGGGFDVLDFRGSALLFVNVNKASTQRAPADTYAMEKLWAPSNGGWARAEVIAAHEHPVGLLWCCAVRLHRKPELCFDSALRPARGSTRCPAHLVGQMPRRTCGVMRTCSCTVSACAGFCAGCPWHACRAQGRGGHGIHQIA